MHLILNVKSIIRSTGLETSNHHKLELYIDTTFEGKYRVRANSGPIWVKNGNNWLYSRFSISSSILQSPNWY